MDDLDFLADLPPSQTGHAILRIILPPGIITSIERRLSPAAFIDSCPLLYHAFEFHAHNGISQASIEAPSRAAVIALLRFCYTGNYLPPCNEDDNQEPDLIHHAQVYKIADDFDVPALRISAYVNMLSDTQIASCIATPPRDLCETIRFLYQSLQSTHVRKQFSPIDCILNYCLQVFRYQNLKNTPDFLEVISELPQFHKDLCRVNFERDFQDEGAMDVLHLVSTPTSNPSLALLKRALGDFQHELMYDSSAEENSFSELDTDSEAGPSPAKRRRSDLTSSTITLVQRPKDARDMPKASEDELLGDEDGFTMVYRPKMNITTTGMDVNKQADSVLSSPELIGAGSSDVESIAGSLSLDILSEEGWDML